MKSQDTFGHMLKNHIEGKMIGRIMLSGEDVGILGRAIEEAGDGDYVEVGSYFGGSAIVAWEAKKGLGIGGGIICIDPFDELYPWRIDAKSGERADQAAFEENMSRFEVAYKHYRVDSYVFDWEMLKEKHNVVMGLVDGSHELPYVRNDLWALHKIGVKIMAVDDYDYDHPAVMREVNRLTFQTSWDFSEMGDKLVVLKRG